MYDEYLDSLPGPSYIVVELKQPLLTAYSLLNHIAQAEFDLTADFARIIELCRYLPRAEIRMKRFITEHPNKVYQLAMTTIGEGWLIMVRQFELANDNGYVNYGFDRWIDPFTLLLRKSLPTE